jgi:hypothetical protein
MKSGFSIFVRLVLVIIRLSFFPEIPQGDQAAHAWAAKVRCAAIVTQIHFNSAIFVVNEYRLSSMFGIGTVWPNPGFS